MEELEIGFPAVEIVSVITSEQINELLRRAHRDSTVYLVGAGGCGMSGLGHLLLDLSHGVAGSDLVENEEVRQLRARSVSSVRRCHSRESAKSGKSCRIPACALIGSRTRFIGWGVRLVCW